MSVADTKAFELVSVSPINYAYSAWQTCVGEIAAAALRSDKSAEEATRVATGFCTSKQNALRAETVRKGGPLAADRVMRIAFAKFATQVRERFQTMHPATPGMFGAIGDWRIQRVTATACIGFKQVSNTSPDALILTLERGANNTSVDFITYGSSEAFADVFRAGRTSRLVVNIWSSMSRTRLGQYEFAASVDNKLMSMKTTMPILDVEKIANAEQLQLGDTQWTLGLYKFREVWGSLKNCVR